MDEVEELKKKLATSQDELGQQKDLNAKLGEAIDGGNKNETALKAQLATSEARRKQAIFEPVGNPGAAKLNTKLVRIQILTP